MRSARQSAIRLLQLMMVASVVLPAVLFVFASWLSYRHEQAVADERLERALDIVHEQALKVFQTGERAIAEVEEVIRERPDDVVEAARSLGADGFIREMPDDAIAGDQQRLHDRLKKIVDAMPQFQAIAVADRNGKVL